MERVIILVVITLHVTVIVEIKIVVIVQQIPARLSVMSGEIIVIMADRGRRHVLIGQMRRRWQLIMRH